MKSVRDTIPPSETFGFNLAPFTSMAGGWLGPLLIFWLYVWGPLRPFHYPSANLAPSLLVVIACVAACLALWWLPSSYFYVRSFERGGRLYEALGIRVFRTFVPDGYLANAWRRRRVPNYRVIRSRREAAAFIHRTQQSEKGHMVLLALGCLSTAFAVKIGWTGWAVYLGAGNVLVNLYPVLLQRYTRARLIAVLYGRSERPSPSVQGLTTVAADGPLRGPAAEPKR